MKRASLPQAFRATAAQMPLLSAASYFHLEIVSQLQLSQTQSLLSLSERASL